jgi:hypothetical protein
MDTGAVIAEVETALRTITGLRVTPWGVKNVHVPAAMVTLPESVDFHQTYGVGSTRMKDLIVLVLASRADARSAVTTLAPYVAELGAKSIKAKLEGYAWTTLEVMTVLSVEFDAVEFAGNPYLAAMFHTDIAGRGAV